MSATVDSLKVFEYNKKIHRILGLRIKNRRWPWLVYDVLLQFFFTFYYSLHILLGLFAVSDPSEIFCNLVINVACIMCSIKHILYRLNFDNMDRFSELIGRLDKSIESIEDRSYHRDNVAKRADYLFKFFFVVYEFVGISSVSMLLMKQQPALIYPAWFPFDWQATKALTTLAVSYQFVGIFMQIFMNILNDSYSPIGLCLLSGHAHLLGMRIKRIGYDEQKTEQQHYDELVECIKDYKYLIRALKAFEAAISFNILFQSVSNGVNLCVCVVYLVFYAANPFQIGYGLCMLIAIGVEFYPCCYYGSVTQINFHKLTYAIFLCNWYKRDKRFRQSLRIFSEITLREFAPYAKNMVKIHLDTYFATIKASYSLFCLVLNYK